MEPGPILICLRASASSQAKRAKMQSTQYSISGPLGEMGTFSAGRGRSIECYRRRHWEALKSHRWVRAEAGGGLREAGWSWWLPTDPATELVCF